MRSSPGLTWPRVPMQPIASLLYIEKKKMGKKMGEEEESLESLLQKQKYEDYHKKNLTGFNWTATPCTY